MKGKWKVLKDPAAGYIVARSKDVDKPMHSGNVELYGIYGSNKQEKQEIADQLNNKEE